MLQIERARLLIQAYILGIPIWWFLGLDFIVLQAGTVILALAALDAHRRFTLADQLLVAIILSLTTSAYIAGFLERQAVTRFLAALYNLSFWVCGLVLAQQVRRILEAGKSPRIALLRSGHLAFLTLVTVGWGSVALAYVLHDYGLVMPSVFGLIAGGRIPDSAPHIQRHALLVFTEVDWGLPGVPMPRLHVFGPYPTATAATAAVLGTMSLLYVNVTRRASLWAPVLEGVILVTVALTLTRSILGGWVLGIVASNILFGTSARRLAACGAVVLAVGLVLTGNLDVTDATKYREYSSESRFENYDEAVDRTLAVAPVLGLGIKPREESHIALGSHSTFVSSFTKGGALGLMLVTSYLVLLPAARWLMAFCTFVLRPERLGSRTSADLRILFNLQVALWIWFGFEDLDAPATAAALIFISIALMAHKTRVGTAALHAVPTSLAAVPGADLAHPRRVL